jgi:UDP-N-acetylglucosamine 4,6-dehydratase
MSVLSRKSVLVTGATGSFGRRFVRRLVEGGEVARVVAFSRDELKQFELRETLESPRLEFVLGDVRDREALNRVFRGIDIVIHAAAMKQVPASENNPMEAIKTNVLGSENVITAALENDVQHVLALSTDKAANPANLYGATKLCADRLFTAANGMRDRHQTRFSIVRYGNVIGSRGSVIPYFMRRRASGVLPITDPRMTRFWITINQAIEFVIASLGRMRGGEVFIPKIPSMKVIDVARVVAPECKTEVIGIRPGEKLHEVMVTADDAWNALEMDDHYVIQPAAAWWNAKAFEAETGGRKVAEDFVYSSDRNSWWLKPEELRLLLESEPIEH